MPATPSDSLLRRYLLPQWRRVVTLALLMALVIALELLSPQILRRFVDDAAKGSALEALVEIALMYLAAAVVLQLAAIGEVG